MAMKPKVRKIILEIENGTGSKNFVACFNFLTKHLEIYDYENEKTYNLPFQKIGMEDVKPLVDGAAEIDIDTKKGLITCKDENKEVLFRMTI